MDANDPRYAFQTSNPDFGRVMVAPVALVVKVCATCGYPTERQQCQLCRGDDEERFYP